MLYTPTTKRALRFCMEAHAGQRDKAGLPYANHPLHLAEQMSTEDETCAALLHDVMEDCGATAEDLLALGVSSAAVRAVELLTHRDGVPYLDYVRALRANPIARRVKAADLRHNCDLTRLDHVTDADVARLRRYLQARVALGDMATELRTPLGAVRMEARGEPFAFELRDESWDGAAYARVDDAYGKADGAFLLKADVLPLAVGESVAVRYDFGRAVDCGSGERVCWRVYQREGVTVGVGFEDDADADGTPAGCTWRYDHSAGAYNMVQDPVAQRYRPHCNGFCVRVAWRNGTSNRDARIVAEVVG
ncbi:HD domain-containing protein [Parafannyhessea sp. LCP21S3_E6]|uniref:HD domain-containing protein n=1 Tax=unclassified Parafannyhessea TaxID=2847323 RepID=UPI003F9E2DF9